MKYVLEAGVGVVGAIAIAIAGPSGVRLITGAIVVGILIVVIEILSKRTAR